MKKSHFAYLFTASAFLAACMASPAIAQDAEHDHSHGAASAAASAPAKPGQAAKAGKDGKRKGGGNGKMDMKAMCDMHKEMMSQPPSERQAMMDEKMKGLSAGDKEQRMKMMDERCK